MSDEDTELLNLFDFYWFEYGVFSQKKLPRSSKVETSPVLQVQVQRGEEGVLEKPKLKPIKTLMRKSLSDQFLSSKDCSDISSGSPSPDSVLVPQLQTILSGKEIEEFPGSTQEKEDYSNIYLRNVFETNLKGSRVHLSRTEDEGKKKRRRRLGRKGSGRSLSELEFEELKGFMDLGFVFSDKDKDSRLVSIIPGLQRLGINSLEESGKVSVSRPYLSEAWEFLEDERSPLMDWRIPAFGNEMELKDHLRYWAHTVASTVR